MKQTASVWRKITENIGKESRIRAWQSFLKGFPKKDLPERFPGLSFARRGAGRMEVGFGLFAGSLEALPKDTQAVLDVFPSRSRR